MAQGTTTTKQARQARVKPTDPKLDAKIVEKLITARIGLLMKAPFYGNLATRLTLVNADEWCPTAATDGRNFYYNTELDRKSTRLNSSHSQQSRMPSSA